MAIKKKSLRKKLIIIGSLITTVMTALILFCAITGFNLKTFIFGTKATGASVVDDTNLVTLTKETPTDGSDPSSYSAMDNFAYFAYKLEHSTYEATTEGAATAKYNGMNVDQKVYDYRLLNGKYSVTDTRSTSTFVKIYHEQFFEGSKVLYRMGDKANYSNMQIKARSNKQEFLTYGYGPDKIIGYIVCPETLVSDTGVNKNDDGTYTSTYELDPTVAPFYYQRKVRANAGISGYPQFVSVKLTYTYDSNWNIKCATYQEVYSIYKMNSWILTDNNITETFTYLSQEEADKKMQPYYDAYKSSFNLPVPADDDVSDESVEMEMGALDYLGTMASLITSENINADLNVKISDYSFNALASVNLIDFSTQLKLDDNYIIYKNDKLYFKNTNKSYYDLNDVMMLVAPLSKAKGSIEAPKLDASSAPIDVESLIEGIMSDINSGVVEKKDNKAYVSIDFNFGDYTVPTTFIFDITDGNINFECLKASYTIKNTPISLELKLLDSFDRVKVDDTYEHLDLAYDVNASLDVCYKDVLAELDGNIYFDILSGNAEGCVTALYDGNTYEMHLYTDSNDIYVSINGILCVKMPISEIFSYVNTSSINASEMIPEVDAEEFDYTLLLAVLASLDINLGENGISVSYNDEIVSGDVRINNISLEINQSSSRNVVIPELSWINVSDLTDMAYKAYELAQDIIDANGLSMSFSVNAYDAYVSGKLYANFDSMSLYVTCDVAYNDMFEEVEITLIKNTIYVSYRDLNVSYTLDGADITLGDMPDVDYLSLASILKSITYTDGLDIYLALSEVNEILGDVVLSITDMLDVCVDSKYANITVSNITAYNEVIALDKEYSEIDEYTVSIKNLVDAIISDNGISFDMSASYMDYSVSGNAAINFNDRSAKATLSVDANGILVDTNVVFTNDTLYVNVFNMDLYITADDIMSLSSFEMPETNYALDLMALYNVFENITFNKGVILTLNLSEVTEYATKAVIGIYSNSLDITVDDINVNVYNIRSFDDEIVSPVGYTNVMDYINMGFDIADIVNNKKVHVDITDVALEVNGISINLSGAIDVIESDVKAQFVVEAFGYTVDIDLYFVDDVFYLTVSNQTLVFGLDEIKEYVFDVIERINTFLEEDIVLEFNAPEIEKILDVVNTITLSGLSINMDLTEIVEDTLIIALSFASVEENWNVEFKTSGIVSSTGNIKVSPSTLDSIKAPTENLLYKSDVLDILDYAVLAYNMKDMNAFDVDIETYIKKSDKNYFYITGNVKVVLNDGINDFDAKADLVIVETRNNSKYGWHKLSITLKSCGNADGMVYATYGNNEAKPNDTVSVKSSYNGIIDLYKSIMSLMKIEIVDDAISNAASMKLPQIDINTLISSLTNSSSLDLVINENAFMPNLPDGSMIRLSVTRDNDKIRLIELDNLYAQYKNENNYLKISETSISVNDAESLVIEAPKNTDSYYDLSNMSNLFEALYNDAQMKDFEINGTVALNVVLFDVNVGFEAKVHVDENGMPEVFAKLSVPDVTLILVKVLEKKTLNIFYKDGYVTLNRVDNDGDNYLVKVTLETFMANALDLMFGEYGLGMPSQVIDLITGAEANGDGFVDASKCVKSVNIGETDFAFVLDMGEIVDNSSLNDMDVVLSTTKIFYEVKPGEFEYRNFLTTIKKFEFKMVNAITLKGNGLSLTNISQNENGDNVITSVDMKEYYSFVESFDDKYDPDTYYKGKKGAYSYVDKIKHTVGFNLGDNVISTELSEGQKINFPYNVGDIYALEDSYYQIDAWYYDSKMTKMVLDLDSEEMSTAGKRYYAKLSDVTEMVMTSEFAISYNGEDILLDLDNENPLIATDALLYDGKNYLSYSSSEFTSANLINKYMSQFVYNNETHRFVLNLYTESDVEGYKCLTLNIDSRFNEKNYTKVYFEDMLDVNAYLPSGMYKSFGIDYFVVDGVEVTLDKLGVINDNMTLNAKYATALNAFKFQAVDNGLLISGYSNDSDTLIMPKYGMLSGEYMPVVGILYENSATPFTSNTTLKTVVISELITEIPSNCFKGCTSLQSVYFPDSVVKVATDAFYVENATTGKNIRFYFLETSSIKEANLQTWLSYKSGLFSATSNYYEKATALKNAYQTYSDYENALYSVIK